MVSYDFHSWNFLLIAIKVVFAFIMSFLAVFLWSKTRKAAEIFLVMAIISLFTSLVYDVLLIFGFFNASFSYLSGFPLLSFIFSLLPYIFFIFSLSFFVKEK
ncbi:MAG: hypothetical protein ACTTJ6_04110 [Treponema sp.]